MKVGELLEMLEQYDDDAEVLLRTQEAWPFENSVAGVVQRQEIHDEDSDESGDKLNQDDVFLLEGKQLRYGTKAAWGMVHS